MTLPTASARRPNAFNVLELMIIVLLLLVVVALLLPALATRRHRHSYNYNCPNNLKQIGLAFKTWALDNNDRLPMQVPVATGGTMELVESGAVYPHFQVMSNELSTPRTLLCAMDSTRTYATNFTTSLADSAISYFVNLDATNENGSTLMCGDRNLTNRALGGSRFVSLAGADRIAWTKAVHVKKGCALFGDGSVGEVENRSAQAVSIARSNATCRLAVP